MPQFVSNLFMITVKKTYVFDPIKDLIGQGGFGMVYKARDLNLGLEVAIKKYSGNLPAKYSLFEEIKRAIKLNHPNLVRYYDAFELEDTTAFGDKIQVGVLEYVNGGDLFALLQTKPSTALLEQIFTDILYGLQYLHQQGIIHRDLKPENILIQREGSGQLIPKIADFGISKSIDGSNAASTASSAASSLVIGSVEYMSPEQFNVQRYGINGQLHTNLDLWSLGVIMCEAFSGKAPFGKSTEGVPRDEIMRNILETEITAAKLDEKIPPRFKVVIQRCLQRYAKDRAKSVAELLALLMQPAGVVNSQTIAFATTQLPNTTNNSNDSLETQQIDTGNQITANKNRTIFPYDETIYPDKKPTGSNKNNTTFPSATTANFSFKNWFGVIVPLITFLLGYILFNSKQTLFGGPTYQYMLAAAISCGLLLAINVLSIVLPRPRHWFEWLTYAVSGLLLLFYTGEAWLKYRYAAAGVPFNFAEHGFAFNYPVVSFAVISIATGLSIFSWWRGQKK